MCALVGLFHPHRPLPPDGGLLRRMATALAHRGPDGEGFHEEPHLALGHRRLAIVDLVGGQQPMANAAGDIVLSFNGEIFNHEGLRRELTALGHRFRTRSDTEAILHAWQQWGLGCLDRLNGQFAFALWDRRRGQLLLARDHLGEKPLHYARLPDGGFAFASEPVALLLVPGVSRQLDPAALDDYLALGYVPDPATIFAGIRRLPAAHFLLIERDGTGAALPRRYWRPPVTTAAAPADAPAELAARLRLAVSMRLMADVPLGCFLSGGVDSAGIAAIAAGLGRPLDSFTIGLPGNDERSAAARLAAQLGGSHHAEMRTEDPLEAARRIATFFGEPFGDSSAGPTHAVSALARRHVTVALSGDGGDEVFAGYRRYRFHQLAEGVRRLLPSRLRRPVLGGLARVYPKLDRAPRWLRARHTLTEMSLDSALGYYATVCRTGEERRRGLFSATLRAELDGHDPAARFGVLMEECDPDEPLLQAQYADLHTYLPGDILAKVDRASMAVSLEVRPPLLDHTLVGWGLALPARLKLRHGVGKHVLRQALAPMLPADLLAGAKRGFAAPLGGALRAAMPRVRARLLGGAMLGSGLFDAAALIRLLDQHESGLLDHAQPLWLLLVLEGFLADQARQAEAPRAAAAA
jgi:asparagine synthase (glutamine-hydrolysing)